MRNVKVNKRNKIKKRIRRIVVGNVKRPRLSVFRSNKEIYAQLVDDISGNTLVSSSSRDKDIKKSSLKRTEISKLVGISLGQKAIKAGLEKLDSTEEDTYTTEELNLLPRERERLD